MAHSAPNALRVFVCSKSDPVGLAELMRSAAEGHVFSVLDEGLSGPELGRTLSHLLQHYGSANLALPSASYTVHFLMDERPYVARCLQIGNFGASLLLSGDHTLRVSPQRGARGAAHRARGAPGLPDAVGARAAGAAGPGSLRHPLTAGPLLGDGHLPTAPVPGVTMEEPAEVAATLRKALRREAVMWLQRANDSSIQLCLESPSMKAVEGGGVLEGHSSGLLEALIGDELDLFFEMGGQSYSGVCVLLARSADGGMTVGLPRSLVIRNWRSLPRFKPVPGQRFLLSFAAPVTGQLTTRPVEDLSVGGLSFSFDASNEIIPAGSRIDATLLLPDGHSADCQLEVRSIQALATDSRESSSLRPFRAGARLSGLTQDVRDIILQAFMAARCQYVAEGADVPFDKLWQLMEEARYRFHPDYPFSAGPPPAVLGDTHHKVYSTGDLGRSLVYASDKGLQGQIAALRIHSRTWLVQHLAVRPGVRRNEQVSYELSNLAVELGEVQQDIEFVRYSWRKDNRWPSRRIGWLARALETPGLSFLRHFAYMRLPLNQEPPTLGRTLPRVREGVRTDFVWIELHLRDRGQLVRVLSEDLLTDEVDLRALRERYKAHGLHRNRRVFVVDGEFGPLAVALSEESTPGLNLLEKTNAFWLLVPRRDHPRAREAVLALVQRCVEHARERGRPSAIGLVDEEDIELLGEAGFENLGRFSEWIFHRSMIRRVCELWRSVFERLSGAPAPDWSGEESGE
ncbi:PilZ domain-containing protein [Cystobacter fuscus]